jgi:hypothetical protein
MSNDNLYGLFDTLARYLIPTVLHLLDVVRRTLERSSRGELHRRQQNCIASAALSPLEQGFPIFCLVFAFSLLFLGHHDDTKEPKDPTTTTFHGTTRHEITELVLQKTKLLLACIVGQDD